METDAFFFVKVFIFLGLLFGALVLVMYGLIFFCSAGVMAKAIKNESEKVTAADRAKIKREILLDAKYDKLNALTMEREKNNKALQKMANFHAASMKELQERLDRK
jgi:hypothetical protein